MTRTESIVSMKPVVAKGRDMMIVTTGSNQTVWVNKSQFDPNAQTITYEPKKAGDEYKNSKGDIAKLQADRNEFVGFGSASLEERFSLAAKYGVVVKL